MRHLNRLRTALVLGFLGLLALGSVPARAGSDGSDELSALLKRIFASRELMPKRFGPARFLESGQAYTALEASVAAEAEGGRDIVRYDSVTGERRVLVPASRLVAPGEKKPFSIDDYAWSRDGKRLLVFTNTKKVWRQNTRGDYWVLDLPDGPLKKLGGAAPASTLMFAKFSPDGGRAAYVRAGNIYVEDLATRAIKPLTADTAANIINGTSDWVYEEELDLRDAFRWSPDGKSIAFWHFDRTGVGDFTLINDTETTYPVVTTIPYPKAGTTNSAVKIGVVSASGGPVRWLELPGDPRNTYVARMDWAESSSEIVLQQLNRLQNTDDVWLADARTGAVRKLLREQDTAWVNIVEEFRWVSGGKELVWPSERDGWRKVYAVSRDSGAERLLTPGESDVIQIARVDDRGEWLYTIASPEDATRRFLYRARADGKGKPERVTPAGAAGTHAYQISPDGRFAIHTFSSFDQPPVTQLVRLPGHEIVRVLEDNAALVKAAAPLVSPPVEFFQVPVGGGVTLDGWMIKPPDFDASKKYPLLMYVYGEPAGTTVNDSWSASRGLFHRALTRAGYIVASVDNRGTPAPRGRAWRRVVYGTVGVLSSEEQTAAVKALLAARPYLDAERVGVWGWSGGGSNTLNLMFRSPDVYKVGMSVAPVPDQRLYDTIYQERYMGLPQDNAEGYRAGSPINFAEGLKGRLLIVHGSGDDNVHYQGTERLVNRLVELGKPFDLMVYPNRSHSISEGEGTSLHIHSLLARYLLEHLPAGPR
ncbi:MAG: S9 family peptidase [Thermoanaerobaculia bacterium]